MTLSRIARVYDDWDPKEHVGGWHPDQGTPCPACDCPNGELKRCKTGDEDLCSCPRCGLITHYLEIKQ